MNIKDHLMNDLIFQFAQHNATPSDIVIKKGSSMFLSFCTSEELAWVYHYVCEENEFP